MDRALILVDIQNDFLPRGALPVPRGDEVVAVANVLLTRLTGWRIVATQDWHPADHRSFASQHPGQRPFDVVALEGLPQVLWPDHCVQHTYGAALARGLETRRVERVFPKGTAVGLDSYSGFFDNARRNATGLEEWLRVRGVGELAVLGLATDFCVKATVLDALSLGFSVTLVEDGCRGVDLERGGSAQAIGDMVAAGARLASSASLPGR